jgi:hypothetical protein
MAHVLSMAASQIRHPIAKLIQMKTDNRLLHSQVSLEPSFMIPERYVTLARMLTRTEGTCDETV